MNDKTKFDPDWIKTDAQKLQIWKDISAEQQETIAGLCKEIEELKRTPDQGAVDRALDLMDRHWEGYSTAKEVIRQALTRPNQRVDVEKLKAEIAEKVFTYEEGNEVESVAEQIFDHITAQFPHLFRGV